jgi:RNA recognition motif-containing protein
MLTLSCNPQISTIYVGGISFDTDERALQNYFQKFGNVTEVKVWPVPATAALRRRQGISHCQLMLLHHLGWRRSYGKRDFSFSPTDVSSKLGSIAH